jgi:hypothetical protein
MSADEKDKAAEAREANLTAKQLEVAAINEKRTGKGTRLRAGQTRGKNPQVVVWEAFDLTKPEFNPSTIAEFMDLTKVTEEKAIVDFLIDGYNDAMYSEASDPIAEYVESSWLPETQKQFRLAVRNYANMVGVSIEDAVNLIKPNLVKSLAKG